MGTAIEFLGLSRSGKTTQVGLLVSALEGAGYSCTVVSRPPRSFEESETVEQWHGEVYRHLCSARAAYLRDPTDYLVYDRGFYDRLALLTADYADGHLSNPFYREFLGAIESRLDHIDLVLLFTVSPELSLARWSRQREDGLDRSNLNSGLDTRDSIAGLRYMLRIYEALIPERVKSNCYEIDGALSSQLIHARIKTILGV